MKKFERFLLHRDDAKERSPELNEVCHTFKDGKTVLKHELLDAEIELHAFFQFNSFKYDVVEDGITGEATLPVDVILKPCAGTDDATLEKVLAQQLALDPHFRHTELTDKEKWAYQQGHLDKEKCAANQAEPSLRYGLGYIAGRKDGWTLLNIKDVDALARIVKQCFGLEAAQKMRQTECLSLSAEQVQQLLARKNHIATARIEKTNQRSTAERSAAAKEGLKTKAKRNQRPS